MSAVAKRSSMTLFSDSEDHYSHRVRMVLAEKGVAVEIVEVERGKINKDLADINPYNSLPTLLDRELVLYEANVIMEYLDERFPHPPLLPVYPVQRALSRLWITRVEKEWSNRIDILLSGKGRESVINRARKELRESIIGIAPIFSEKPYFMNDEFTLVDCCVSPILWRLKHVGISLPERSTKPLQNYMQTIFERETFKESLSEYELEMNE